MFAATMPTFRPCQNGWGWCCIWRVSSRARYIFGGNESGESIAMTAPVSMWEEANQAIAFTMPSACLADMPEPNRGCVAGTGRSRTAAILGLNDIKNGTSTEITGRH